MTQYQTAGPGARPKSTDLAIKLIWVSIAIGVVVTVINLFAAPDGVEVSVGSSIVSLVISSAIPIALAIFIGKGANWARIVLTVILGLGIVLGLFGLLGAFALGFPLLGLVQLISLALSVAIIVMLFRPDSNAFFSR